MITLAAARIMARWMSISSPCEFVNPSSVMPPALITATSAWILEKASTASGPTNTPNRG